MQSSCRNMTSIYKIRRKDFDTLLMNNRYSKIKANLHDTTLREGKLGVRGFIEKVALSEVLGNR